MGQKVKMGQNGSKWVKMSPNRVKMGQNGLKIDSNWVKIGQNRSQ